MRLYEVFGVRPGLPEFTYVDRSGLDNLFSYYVDASKHIVIHGPSKQGKTVLWKNKFKDGWYFQIGCTPTTTVSNILSQILVKLGVSIPKSKDKELKISSGEQISQLIKGESTWTESSEYPDLDAELVHLVAESLKKAGTRVILEDFHYLPEEQQKSLSFVLKALGEEGCFLIVVGVWPQQNLLTFYNGDLRGRVEEVDLKWTPSELLEVINKGAYHLNFSIDSEFANQVVSDSYSNVGLLQRIMERVCLKEGITESLIGNRPKSIKDISVLETARKELCEGEALRYQPILELLSRGYKKREDSTDVYRNILKVALSCSDQELLSGISYDSLFNGVLAENQATQRSSLTQALQRLGPLQLNKNVKPPILYYNHDSKKLYITEPEFLFFRKYGNLPVEP